jgi:hypothetical protein
MHFVAYSQMAVAKGGSLVAHKLPPTEDAIEFHAMRVYLQSVTWCTLGQTALEPTNWGWHFQDGHLIPVQMRQKPVLTEV